MASSSSLYDNSDSESLSNELSPTDGYFNERHTQPQGMMVPDPSQRNAGVDKEREAHNEAHASPRSHSRAEVSWHSSGHSRTLSEVSPRSMPTRLPLDPGFDEEAQNSRTPLLPSSPPAYSPPTSNTPYGTSRSFGRSTGPTRSALDVFHPFLSSRAPEDLGGRQPLLGGPPRDDGWRNRNWDWLCENTNRIAKGLLIFLAIAVGVGFIVDVALGVKSSHKVRDQF